MSRWLRAIAAILLMGSGAQAQEIFDLLIENARLIDPANGRDKNLDLAITGNKIVLVGDHAPPAHARTVIDATGFYVTPGFIDMETSPQADYNTIRFGVTTVATAHVVLSGGSHSLVRVVDAPEASATAESGAKMIFRSEVPKLQSGVHPAVICSGMKDGNDALVQPELMTTMSKFLNMGMSLNEVVASVTKNAAQAIGHPELGTLSEGKIADIAILDLQEGHFAFLDAAHKRLDGSKRLRCILTIRDGKIVWDSEGLAATDASRAGPYSNFK